jgi:NAD+ synthase (glutamine-hydrolysing)
MENTMNLLRVAGATPKVHIGNVTKNCEEIKNIIGLLYNKADLIVTPELSLTGYTCADLFTNRRLLEMAVKGLMDIVEYTKQFGEQSAAVIVGLPLEIDGELFNVAAFIQNGQLIALVPKTYLPNYGEFYEKRWFTAREYDVANIQVSDGDRTLTVPFGNNVIIEMGTKRKVNIGIEICEDAWAPVSPGRILALNGAEIIVNLSASNEVIGKAQYRRNLVGSVSAGCICGYVYVSAGRYESTSDLVFSGHNLMYENGKLLGEVKPFEKSDSVIIKDFNLTKIRHDRLANKTFADCKNNFSSRSYVKINCKKPLQENENILARVSITPFVPSRNRRERSLDIFNMQVAGLQRRLEATKSKCIVVGVSGGLDSTLALLVSAQAVKNLGLPSTTVTGITMPGFGTTSRTKDNSHELMRYLGCDIKEISIVDAVRQHFSDIGQDENTHDITYENCQARERTQILMDVANKNGGFVIGTGDLSELALGWCTYNGDHMSMYAVNTSIPKTLVRTLVDEIGHNMAENGFDGMDKVIEDIIDTPVSPELLPPNPDGTIAQKTEDTVGSYILHDFFLYYTLRYGMTPYEIRTLCQEAVNQSSEYKFSDEEIAKWQKVFYTRFFRQQFKRNCMPDGVKVGSVSVSPRGDLRLPSEIESEDFI